MENPNPNSNRFITLTLLGLLGCLYFAFFHNKNDILPDLIGLAGITLAPTAFVIYLIFAFDAARFNRLKKGKGILARWSIPPDLWHAFLALNNQINESSDSRRCEIPSARVRRTQPVEILIGQTGAMMDGDFHPLPHNGFTAVWLPRFHEGPPPYLEFLLATSGSDDSATPHALRLPIPDTPTANQDILAIQQYFQSHLATVRQSLPPPTS